MTRDELVLALAWRAGIADHSARVFLHAFFDTAKQALRGGEELDLPGLGQWSVSADTRGMTFQPIAQMTRPVPPRREDAQPQARERVIKRYAIPVAALDGVLPRSVGQPVNVSSLFEELGIETRRLRPAAVDMPTLDAPPEDDIDASAMDFDLDGGDAIFEEDGTTGVATERIDAASPEQRSEEFDIPLPSAVIRDRADVPDHEDGGGGPVMDAMAADSLEAHEVPLDDNATAVGAALAQPLEAMPGVVQSYQDDEEFHRHREQLYNPPAERKGGKWMIYAAVALTLIVLAIIVYLLTEESNTHELPGVDTSTLLFPTTAPDMASATGNRS